MNDRFKLKCFNKLQNKIYKVRSISYYQGNIKRIEVDDNGKILIFDDYENNIDNSILIQSTGLKDKNGKLIYELDYIKYKKETYKLNIDKFLGITLTNILNGDIIVMDDLILFDCEVISNEFECNTKI